MTPELLLIGGGGHCRSCIEAIESTGKYTIKGIIGLPEEVHHCVLGHRIIGSDDNLSSNMAEGTAAIVTIGQIKSARLRIKMYEKLQRLNFRLPVIVAASAVVSRNAQTGMGSIVMHGGIVNAGASVGVNAIVNSRALIEHDVTVGDHCHISTGAILNGGVEVGRSTFVGSGAVVHQGIRIGNNVVVAAGAIVSRNVPDNEVVRTERNHFKTGRNK